MGKTHKRFTPKEDQIIIEEIKNSPNNMNQGFENASSKLYGRSPGSISKRYYNKLRDQVPMLATGNNQVMIVNRKNLTKSFSDPNGNFDIDLKNDILKKSFEAMPKEILRSYA